jgi:hypothetical protein
MYQFALRYMVVLENNLVKCMTGLHMWHLATGQD